MRTSRSKFLIIAWISGISGFTVLTSFADTALSHYFDEESGRHLTLDESDIPRVLVEFRFPGDPGFFSRWSGRGTRVEREITFTRNVGEEEPRGSNFLAVVGASRVKIDFAPGQLEPGDEGLNGEYRRLSEEKRQSMAIKDFKSAEAALEKALKNLGQAKEPAIVEFKKRWPDLRTRLTALRFPSASTATPAPKPAPSSTVPAASAAQAPPEESPDYWLTQIETTGMAISFANQPFPEAVIPPDGSGDYDDGFGGRASLRASDDGTFRVAFGWQRGDLEAMGSDLSLDIPADKVIKDRDGDWTATLSYQDPNLAPGDAPAQFRIQKSGRFLLVTSENTTRYTGKAWLDGIYRWGPIPVQE